MTSNEKPEVKFTLGGRGEIEAKENVDHEENLAQDRQIKKKE
jgi:hypothetical protein